MEFGFGTVRVGHGRETQIYIGFGFWVLGFGRKDRSNNYVLLLRCYTKNMCSHLWNGENGEKNLLYYECFAYKGPCADRKRH